MIQLLLAVLAPLLICAAAGERAGGSDKTKAIGNPFGTTKVGDFAVYKRDYGNVILIQGHETWKKTATAKDQKSVKLKFERDGLVRHEVERTIDLIKSYDMVLESVWMVHPVLVMAHPILIREDDKFEKTGEGTEKIKVAGKEYNAHWITGKLTRQGPGPGEIIPNIKVWFSEDAPLDGLLRIKTDLRKKDSFTPNKRESITVELSEFGSAK